jgi:ribonuclease HI
MEHLISSMNDFKKSKHQQQIIHNNCNIFNDKNDDVIENCDLIDFKNCSIKTVDDQLDEIIILNNNQQITISYEELLNFGKNNNNNNKKKNNDYYIIKNTTDEPDENYYLMHFDGLSNPNPGESTAGAIIYDYNGNKMIENGKYLGNRTNNQAEYEGMITGLKLAIKQNIKNIKISGDSALVINQCANKNKIKNDELKKLYDIVVELFAHFDNVMIKHVYREQNKDADEVTNKTFRKKKSYIRNYNKEIEM